MNALPDGISSSARRLPEVDGQTLVVDRSEGAGVFDRDGRRFVDMAMAMGATILGHAHPAVVAACTAALQRGPMPGFTHAAEAQAAQALVRHAGPLTRATFVSTGSEAVHLACRIARRTTGRAVIAKVAAGYDGWYDDVALGWTGSREADLGGPRPLAHGTTLVRWNDLADLEALFAERDDIAAVLVEPVLANAGCLMPEPGYLAALGRLCRRHGAMVIADEVLTGMRLHPGPTALHLGLEPDLAAMGPRLPGAPAASGQVHAVGQFVRIRRAGLGLRCLSVPRAAAPVRADDAPVAVLSREGGVDVPRDAATGLPVFTDSVLSDPRVTEILAPTAKDFMRDTFQTMEIVTKLTKTGDKFTQLYDESRALGVKGNVKDAEAVIARGMNALMTRKDYVDPEFIKLAMQVGPDTPYSIASTVLEQMESRGALRAELGKKGTKATSVLTDLARVFDPRAEETTRIEFGLGTFQGDFSQNLRIPLGSVPEQYRAAYLAILGKPYAQAAQAASSFISTAPGGTPSSYSVFFRGRVDTDFLGQMAKRLSGAGHEANISIRPNGIVVDVMPQFGDAGPVPIDPKILKEMADAAAGDSTTASVIDRDFSSIYLERPNYAGEINKAKKGLLNESAREIAKITGARQAAARDFAAGTGPELSGNKAINRRAEKARDRYRQRLSQLESIQARLRDMAKEFERDMAKANKVMERKLERARKAKQKPAQPAPAGLDDI